LARAGAPIIQIWNYADNWDTTTKERTAENRTYSPSDQMTQIAGNAATHDAKGNLTDYEINSKEYEVDYYLDNHIIKVDVQGLVP
jgi:hypothetical protein